MKECEIHIYGSHSKITGEFDPNLVRTVTSYPVEGAEFSPSYRKKLWDGRKHLYNLRTGSFPTGLITLVKTTLENNDTRVTVVDHREEPDPKGRTFELANVKMEGKFDYQLEACKTAIQHKQGIIRIATNGGKSTVCAGVVQYLKLKTLIIVPSRELLYQFRKSLQGRLGVGDKEVGIIGDGNWEPGTWATIAIVDTLESRIDQEECQEFLKTIQVLFFDEAHRLGSETWYTVSTLCPAFYRFGMSGTPLDRSDGADLRLIAATGDVIVNIPNKFLVDRGVSARAQIIFDSITDPVLDRKKKFQYQTVYKQCVTANPALLKKVVEWAKIFHAKGLGLLILVEEIEHGKAIDEALWTDTDGQFIPHQFIHGSEDTETRSSALKDFAEGRLPVLISSRILDEGVDVPTIDAMILAGSRKSKIKTLQRLGRGLRGEKLILVEFANYCHKHLVEHSLQRLNDYRAEECFDIYNSGPSKELVDKLWAKKR